MSAIYRKDFIPPEKLYPLMGQNIKRLRTNHKMTQAQLAELIDMDQKQISHIETGRSREKLSVYLRIANIFGVSIDHFLADALLIDQEDVPADALAGDAEQTFLREVIHAAIHYLKGKET